MTVGAVISLITFVVFVDRRFGALEAQGSSLDAQVETLSRRQNTYIDRRNEQHEQFTSDMSELGDRLDRLCEALAANQSATVCN